MRRTTITPLILTLITIFSSLNLHHATAKQSDNKVEDKVEENVEDKTDDCRLRAAQGECRLNQDFMKENCAATCKKFQGTNEFRIVEETETSFFDLEAKDLSGRTLSFDRFDGYVTLVVNLESNCDHVDNHLQSLAKLHDKFPYTLEVIVFRTKAPPIEVDEGIEIECHEDIADGDDDENPKQCSEFYCPNVENFAKSKKGENIRVMEEVSVNGPETHPVYRYLKGKFDIETLDEAFATFFLVTPDGHLEMHRFIPSYTLRDIIRKHVKDDL